MKLMPYRGFGGLLPLQREVNRLFEGFFPSEETPSITAEWMPSVDVVDTPERLEVRIEAPGIDPKDLDISVAEDVLTVKGEKRSEKEEKGKTFYRREICAGAFSRSVPLPAGVDAEHIEAESKNGLVTVRLPKREVSKARRIQVKST